MPETINKLVYTSLQPCLVGLGPLSAKVLEYLRNKGHQLQLTTVNTTDHVDGVARINETVHGHADSRGKGTVTFAD